MTQFDISTEQRSALIEFQDALTNAMPHILTQTTLPKFFAVADAWKEVRRLFSLDINESEAHQHKKNEECMTCVVCGLCKESLDANDICADCQNKI